MFLKGVVNMKKKIRVTETIWNTTLKEEFSYHPTYDTEHELRLHLAARLADYFYRFGVIRYLINVETKTNEVIVTVKEIDGEYVAKGTYKWEL